MGLVNYGNQNVIFSYKESGTSENFNRLYYKILKPGIYSGGVLSKSGTNTITISPTTAYIEDNNYKLGVRVQTTDSVDITVEETNAEYIVLRYVWSNIEGNYMDVVSVPFSNILATDVIIGKAIYEEGILQETFDYTRRNKGRLNESIVEPDEEVKSNPEDYFFVQAKEPPSNKVIVKEGFILTYQGELIFINEQDSPTFSDTVDGRVDLLYINYDGTIQVQEGTDSSSPTTPMLNGTNGAYVLAKITRGAGESYITGNQVTNYNREIAYLNNINLAQLDGVALSGLPLNDGNRVNNLNADSLNGAEKSTDNTLSANSDTLIASQSAIKGYISTKEGEGGSETKLTKISEEFSRFDVIDGSYLQASDAEETDGATNGFGSVCGISKGDNSYFIIGAPNYNTDAGGIYINRRIPFSSYINNLQYYTSNDIASGDHFGASVAMDGVYAVAGSPNQSASILNGGAIYTFRENPTDTWTQSQKIELSSPSTDDLFGSSVDMGGDYLAASAPGKNAVYIFRRVAVDTWDSDVYEITPSDGSAGDNFGYSIKMSGDYIIIGAPNHNSDTGAAYIYQRTATNTWENEVKITPSSITTGNQAGYCVDIKGDWCGVGAPYYNTNEGLLSIYKRGTGNSWTEQKQYFESDISSSWVGNYYASYRQAYIGTDFTIGTNGIYIGCPNFDVYIDSFFGDYWDNNTGVIFKIDKTTTGDSWGDILNLFESPPPDPNVYLGKGIHAEENLLLYYGSYTNVPSERIYMKII